MKAHAAAGAVKSAVVLHLWCFMRCCEKECCGASSGAAKKGAVVLEEREELLE